MAVYHILKDGSRPKDLTGHVVRVGDDNNLYEIIHRINKRLCYEQVQSKAIERNDPEVHI